MKIELAKYPWKEVDYGIIDCTNKRAHLTNDGMLYHLEQHFGPEWEVHEYVSDANRYIKYTMPLLVSSVKKMSIGQRIKFVSGLIIPLLSPGRR